MLKGTKMRSKRWKISNVRILANQPLPRKCIETWCLEEVDKWQELLVFLGSNPREAWWMVVLPGHCSWMEAIHSLRWNRNHIWVLCGRNIAPTPSLDSFSAYGSRCCSDKDILWVISCNSNLTRPILLKPHNLPRYYIAIYTGKPKFQE